MNILLVVANFYPEIGSASHLFLDLAIEFDKKGHNVQVLTSFPRSHLVNNYNKKIRFKKNECYKNMTIIGSVKKLHCLNAEGRASLDSRPIAVQRHVLCRCENGFSKTESGQSFIIWKNSNSRTPPCRKLFPLNCQSRY